VRIGGGAAIASALDSGEPHSRQTFPLTSFRTLSNEDSVAFRTWCTVLSLFTVFVATFRAAHVSPLKL
jgi:hypothetical protein